MNITNEKTQVLLLIVGNSQADRETFRAVFETEYRVETVKSGAQTLQIMHSEANVAVLCNLNKPECFEILEEMRSDKAWPQLPVFAVATEEDDDSQIRAFDLGAEDVITKPVKPRIARARVKTAIENHWNQIDLLTGLYSHNMFCREAARIIAENPPGSYLLACFDVDNFKAINAQYGWETGDYVLQQLANLLVGFVGSYRGIACRVSADNFALLLPSDTPALLPELVVSLEDVFKDNGTYIKLQLSIGRYIIKDKSLPFNDMMNNALVAKRTVKGRYNAPVAVYNKEMQARLLEEQHIISQMDYALADGQFEVWFQPQYNHETGALAGAEALTRWRSTEDGAMIPPDVFIPVFERNGFIYELDKYVWEQVCTLLRRWQDEGKNPVPVSVNVSRIDIFEEDFFEKITAIVEKHRIKPDLLQLEITESALTIDTARIIETVRQLRDYGFVVEIDDFGSGYSSFNVLKDIPADVLKLDMRFLSGEDKTGRGGNIIESIVRMAKWIGMRTIAEGVETIEQADFLHSIGCVLIQGYLYNRPMPVAEFEKLAKSSVKTRNTGKFETINALDSNAFWDSESIESLIFNSYVGGACVVEFANDKCEVIRANEKYRKEMRTDLPLAELLKIDPFTLMSEAEANRVRAEVRRAKEDGMEMRGEVTFFFNQTNHHTEYLRYYGRVIAKGPIRSVVYLLIENITSQKRVQQKAKETTEQLRFLNEISKSILSKPDTKDAIKSLLQKQMAYFDSDRAYIIELYESQQMGDVSYRVCAKNTSSQIRLETKIPYSEIPTWIDILKRDNHIVIEDVSALTSDRSYEKQKLSSVGINSLIAVALRRDGELIGMLGVDQPRRALNHVEQLTALGDYVSVLLNRRDLMTKIESDNLYMERLMNDTPGGFVRVRLYEDGRSIPVFINDGFCEMTGMTKEEAMAFYAEDTLAGIHPDDIPELQRTIERALTEDFIVSTRIRFHHKEKGYIHLQVFYRITTDADGTKYSNGYYADMTATTLLEERRKELLDNLPCGAIVYELAADGKIKPMHINKRYQELVNRYTGELHVHDSMQAIHPDDHDRMIYKIKEAIKRDCDMECDARVERGGGGYTAFHIVGHISAKENQKTMMYTTYTPINEETRSLSVALADQRKAELLAKEVNGQLRFLNDASRYLLMGGKPDEAIHLTLHKTMEYFNGDRAYIFELDDEKQVSNNTYELCAPGILPEKENLQRVPYALQKYALETFKNKGTICLENLDKISGSGINEKQIITDQGIHSLILVPLWIGEKLIGFMGVDNPKQNVSHADQLAALGDYMAAMILRRNNEAQILSDNRMMRDLMNDMPGGFVQMKMYPDGRVEPAFINEEFCRMSGMSHEECVEYYGRDAYTGLHPDDQDMVRSAMDDLIEKRTTRTLRLRLAKGDGGYAPMQVFYRVTDDSAGNLYLSGYYTDLTEQIALEEREMAEHDELTGLFNRTKLANMQNGEYQTLSSCGVLFFDVNHLKEVNDTQGHEMGDALLRLVADSIRSITGRDIHGYRYGGDEFLAVVCDCKEAELAALIERWQMCMDVLTEDKAFTATAAVGAAWSKAPVLLGDLIRKADRAMYTDKQKTKRDKK